MDVKAGLIRKPDEAKINAFEIKCLRQVLRVSWTAKKTNKWVLNTAGVERSLLASVKERKLVYFGHVMRKKGDSLEKRNHARHNSRLQESR